MEIIKITGERMEQILPQTVKDSDLSKNAKKVLATIINYHLVNDKVRTTGFLAINNDSLRESAGIGKEYLRGAIQELIECKLIERKVGQKWKAGEKGIASEYRLNIENIRKPIQKPSSENLLEMLFSTPLKPLCTKDSPTNTITNTSSDTITNTKTNSKSETVTIADTVSDIEDNIEYNKIYNNIIDNKNNNILIEKLDSTELKNEVEDNDKIFNKKLTVETMENISTVEKDKFQLLNEFVEERFKNISTYQETVSQITPILEWIRERYRDSHNVEQLQHYANDLISKKLEVLTTVSQ